MHRYLTFVLLTLTSNCATAQSSPSADPALTVLVRDQLIQHMPRLLAETDESWGKQSDVTVGMKLVCTGTFSCRLEPQRAIRNEGHWHRLKIAARDPQNTMLVSLSNMKSEESGRMTFDATISTLVELNCEQQLWKSGICLLSTETRARATAGVRLQCEATNRFDFQPGTVVPELVLRFRVTHADVFVNGIVVERTLGMNGMAARTIGEMVKKLVKRFQPDLERKMLDRANEAVLKAADTKEIRIGFQKLLPVKQ